MGADFRTFARLEQWEEAAGAFDKAHRAPSDPLLLFARARFAYHLGDWPRASALLEQLGDRLPELSAERLEMQRAAPSTGDAVPDSRSSESAIVAHVQRLEQAGKLADALAFVRAVQADWRRSRPREARRVLAPLEARLLEGVGQRRAAASALRELLLAAGCEGDSVDWASALKRLSALPTRRELFARAERCVSVAPRQALQLLDMLPAALGPSPHSSELARARAWAYYNSKSDYGRAAELFQQAGQASPKHRAQDTFYAARALSRAQRDDAAQRLYHELIARYPRSGFAEQARYLSARLHYIAGAWSDAVKGYDAYLRIHGEQKGRHSRDVVYERAVALIAAGKGAEALNEAGVLGLKMRSPRLRNLVRELEGVALLQAGRRDAARDAFESVVATRPLSFAALVAQARLREMGVPTRRLFPIEGERSPEPAQSVAEPLQLRLPQRVEQLRSVGLHRDAERALQEMESALRAQHEPRGAEALCSAYGALIPARARYRFAQRVVRERVLFRPIAPDTRWLWECVYPEPYLPLVRTSEERYGLPENVLYAFMRQESGFAPGARSPVGATGLMQIMPATAAHIASELGEPAPSRDQLSSPGVNVRYSAFYLAKLLAAFERNLALAAAAYNAGPTAAKRWLRAAGELPLDVFVAHIPYRETRHYVSRVVGNWARYSYVDGGERAVAELVLALPSPVAPHPGDY